MIAYSMLKGFCGIIFALVIWGAAGTFCYAQDTQTNTTAPQPRQKRLSGTVAQVKFAESMLVVQTDESGYITIDVPDNTPIMRGSRKVKLDDIDTGDSVTLQCFYNATSDQLEALSIRDSTPEMTGL